MKVWRRRVAGHMQRPLADVRRARALPERSRRKARPTAAKTAALRDFIPIELIADLLQGHP